MSIEGALLSRLRAQVPSVAGRVYAVQLPQDTELPAITYQRVATAYTHVSGSRAKSVRARWQISCWDSRYAGALQAADEALAALDRFAGTVDGTVIQQIFADGMQETASPELGETGLYHVARDFVVFYEE